MISLLRVSHIETGAPPSPDPNYDKIDKIFKSWLIAIVFLEITPNQHI